MNVMIGGEALVPKTLVLPIPGPTPPQKNTTFWPRNIFAHRLAPYFQLPLGLQLVCVFSPLEWKTLQLICLIQCQVKKPSGPFRMDRWIQITVTIKFGKRDTWPALLSYILVSCCGIISGPRESTPWPLAACSSMQSPHLEVPPNSLYLWVSVSGQIGKNSSCDANVVVWSLYS